jgi:O-antigen/teichoic acid export membrane protein
VLTAVASHGRRVVDGSVRVFLAEALVLPTSLVTAGFLTRRLGPSGYGQFTLAATVIGWLEYTSSSLFARATYKAIAEAEDWRPVGSMVVLMTAVASASAAVLVSVLAPVLAVWLHEPDLTRYLWLFVLDIPLFGMAQAHRNILVGMGAFRARAWVSAWRWSTRMVLIILLVGAGLSVTGAILGSVGASAVELLVSRRYVRPPLGFRRPGYPAHQLWDYAVPLFLAALALRLLDKLDLFMLTALGGSAAQAGQYGAAQNLAVVPGLVSLSCAAVLLATLSGALSRGEAAGAREMGRNAMRFAVLLLPFGAMTAGASVEIVVTVYGSAFAPAGPVLGVLIFGALAGLMLAVASAILTAGGRPRWVLGLTAPLVPAALAGYALAIPRFGVMGAASVTALVAVVGAAEAAWAVQSLWRTHVAVATLGRSMIVSAGAYGAAAWWPATGLALVVKLVAIMAAVPLAYWALGELTPREIALVSSAARHNALVARVQGNP